MTLHGTKPINDGQSRISLRYIIKKNNRNKEKKLLIDKIIKNDVTGDLKLNVMRSDININSKKLNQIIYKKRSI